jgi:hypothetical protein
LPSNSPYLASWKLENAKKSPKKSIITGNPGGEIVKSLEIQAFSKIAGASQSYSPERRKRAEIACKTGLLMVGLGT